MKENSTRRIVRIKILHVRERESSLHRPSFTIRSPPPSKSSITSLYRLFRSFVPLNPHKSAISKLQFSLKHRYLSPDVARFTGGRIARSRGGARTVDDVLSVEIYFIPLIRCS